MLLTLSLNLRHGKSRNAHVESLNSAVGRAVLELQISAMVDSVPMFLEAQSNATHVRLDVQCPGVNVARVVVLLGRPAVEETYASTQGNSVQLMKEAAAQKEVVPQVWHPAFETSSNPSD